MRKKCQESRPLRPIQLFLLQKKFLFFLECFCENLSLFLMFSTVIWNIEKYAKRNRYYDNSYTCHAEPALKPLIEHPVHLPIKA